MKLNMGAIEHWTSFIRDVFLIGGVPTLIIIGKNLYSLQVDALKARTDALEAQNSFLKETQFDRAATVIEGQRKDYELEREESQKELDKLRQEGSANQERVKQLQARLAETSAKIQAVDTTSGTFLQNVLSPGPGNSWIASSTSPDGKKIALMRAARSYAKWSTVEVYDRSDAYPLGSWRFDYVGIGSPIVRWSQDSSKLLVSWNYADTAKVTALKLVGWDADSKEPHNHLDSLGTYETKPPGGQIETLAFSDDGRSVSIKRVDGTTEDWQP